MQIKVILTRKELEAIEAALKNNADKTLLEKIKRILKENAIHFLY